MSNKHKIFGSHPRQGIQIQGRNAQVSMPPTRMHDPSDPHYIQKHDLSPFSGYSLGNTQNTLMHSQVNEQNSEQIRKMIREEISKINKEDKNKNQLGVMKAEIRSLKESVQELSTTQQSVDSSKEQIHSFVVQNIEEYKIQTAKNLREVVKKIDENTKKQCLNQLGRQYIPVSFIDEVEKQFNQLDDRLQILESKIQGGVQIKNRTQQFSENAELKFHKLEREIESLKKQAITEQAALDANTKQLRSLMNQLTLKQDQKNQQLRSVESELNKKIFELSKQKISHQTFDKFKKRIEDDYQEKIGQLNKKVSESSSDFKEFLNSSKNMVLSSVFENNSGEEEVVRSMSDSAKIQKSPQKDEKIEDKNQLKDPIIETKEHKDLFISPKKPKQSLKNGGKENEQKQIQEKVMYQVDKQLYLMDENGDYIVDNENKMIKLSDEHMKILRESNLVKLKQ